MIAPHFNTRQESRRCRNQAHRTGLERSVRSSLADRTVGRVAHSMYIGPLGRGGGWFAREEVSHSVRV